MAKRATGYRTIHVFYNNKDHYDVLLEIVDFKDMQPAFLQPPPPTYFNFDTSGTSGAFPPLGTKPPWQPKRGSGFNAPRPNRKQPPAKETSDKQEGQQAEDEDEPVTSLMQALGDIPVSAASKHPHRQVEDFIKDRAILGIGWERVAFSFCSRHM